MRLLIIMFFGLASVWLAAIAALALLLTSEFP
jgi:hypothetical protein